MPETHQKLERKIVELLESFFTPCSLRIDLLLQNTIKEDPDRWVRMDFFSHGHRLGGLAKDEAVVAKAVRQYSEILEVNEYGDCVRTKQSTHPHDFDAKRTVYLENLPRDSTYKSLKEMLKDFATIDQIVWPAPLLHGEIYEPSKRTSIYAFVTCVTEKECLKLRSAIRSLRLSKGGRGSQSLKRVRDDLDGIRVLPITEWDFRTKIYMEKQQERKEKLTALLRGASGTETTLKFEGGTVCQFKNVHPNTSAKVLKQLFEMVAPVSFVDYQRGEKEGYVRFKTSSGAILGSTFFRKEEIFQTHKDDTGTLRSKSSKKRKTESFVVEVSDQMRASTETVEVVILKGVDEARYWKHINHSKKERDGIRAAESKILEPVLIENSKHTHHLFED